MTSDEQRIYAMMGISPLVLASQEVTDLKNIAISVVLPGEAASLSVAAPVEPEPSPASTVEVEVSKPSVEVGKPIVRRRQKPESEPTPEIEVLSQEGLTAEPVIAEAVETPMPEKVEDTGDSGNEAEETEASGRRRRRRRSSAATNH